MQNSSTLAIHRHSIVARRGTRYHWFISGISHSRDSSCSFQVSRRLWIFYESLFPSPSSRMWFCRMVVLLDPLSFDQAVSSDSSTYPIIENSIIPSGYQVAPKLGHEPAVVILTRSASGCNDEPLDTETSVEAEPLPCLRLGRGNGSLVVSGPRQAIVPLCDHQRWGFNWHRSAVIVMQPEHLSGAFYSRWCHAVACWASPSAAG